MIGIPLGWVASNAGEWFIHKYMLHGLGRSKKSFWSFHWHDHHNASRRNEMYDSAYTEPLFRGWDPQTKEAAALIAGAVAAAPLFPVAPFFVGTVWYCMWRYHRIHKRAHLDPEWAREHLPWHYDHHMAPDQDANWCVTNPLWDKVMGTRVEYLGTETHQKDMERRRNRRRVAVPTVHPGPNEVVVPQPNRPAAATSL